MVSKRGIKKNKVDWKAETARDFVALGSIGFFLLVLMRVYLLNNPQYFNQFVLSGIIFLLLFIAFRSNIYSGLGLIVLIFTSLYYAILKFTIFGAVAYLLLLGSLFYLKYDTKKIFLGILFGLIGAGVSYFVL